MTYLKTHTTRRTPQSQPLPDASQVENSAGGYVWAVDPWTRLRRFLVLGSAGGSYYASEQKLTTENVAVLQECLRLDGQRTVSEIVAVSEGGRAPRNEEALYALAAAAAAADVSTRQAALEALPRVARTATHMFQFATFVEGFRGWGRSLRRAVGGWYAGRDADQLAYQLVKYRSREGWKHADLLRLAHPARKVSAGNPTLDVSDAHAGLFAWALGREAADLPRLVEGYERAQRSQSVAETVELVREYRLPHEALLSEHLRTAEVWEALLEDMPMTALVRNLGRMSANGLLTPGSEAAKRVVAQLGDEARIRKARVHPMSLLIALKTYARGRGDKGSLSWAPVSQVVDALDASFYLAFGNVKPTGKRHLLALDVSASMTWSTVAKTSLMPRDAAAAMALITAAVEPEHEIVAFASAGAFERPSRRWARSGIRPLALSPRQRLDDVVRLMESLPAGGTDCALPMLYATAEGREVDSFVIYTDNETWAGDVHPKQALDEYRRHSGRRARLATVAMVSNGFSIADPTDVGMLDVVGFDTATPELLAAFANGEV